MENTFYFSQNADGAETFFKVKKRRHLVFMFSMIAKGSISNEQMYFDLKQKWTLIFPRSPIIYTFSM